MDDGPRRTAGGVLASMGLVALGGDMGGKPNPGTPKDKRLSANKPKTGTRKK